MSQCPDCLLPCRQLHPENRPQALASSTQLTRREETNHCKGCLGHYPESHATVPHAYTSGICCHLLRKATRKTQTKGPWVGILGGAS